jgi:aryl-alcohol dehydrogenase-like predicted oxidoreductase
MARHFGMALCPWDVVGGGKFQTKKQLEAKKKAGEGLRSMMGSEQTEDEKKISEALEKVAGEVGVESITAVALAYVMQVCFSPPFSPFPLFFIIPHFSLQFPTHHLTHPQKTPNVFPIIGGRKVEHLKQNIQALSIHLSDKQIEYLESVKDFEIGFPGTFVGDDPKAGKTAPIIAASAPIVFAKFGKPIGHE